MLSMMAVHRHCSAKSCVKYLLFSKAMLVLTAVIHKQSACLGCQEGTSHLMCRKLPCPQPQLIYQAMEAVTVVNRGARASSAALGHTRPQDRIAW